MLFLSDWCSKGGLVPVGHFFVPRSSSLPPRNLTFRAYTGSRLSVKPHSHRMKVPQPVRAVFDAFPLKEYPPALNEHHKSTVGVHFFSRIDDNSDTNDLENFHLAVHKVSSTVVEGKTKYLPSDPISLASALILCYRHHLLLPSDQTDRRALHTLRELSYLASPDNELPMMIETKGATTQRITPSNEITRSVSNAYFKENSGAFFINHYLDRLVDLWIFILLADIPQSHNSMAVYSRLFFQDEAIQQSEPLLYLTILKLVTEISNWSSFRTRYSFLFQKEKTVFSTVSRISKRNILKGFAVCDEPAFEKVYFEKLAEFERFLLMIMNYLKNTEDSPEKKIIEIKIASFCFSVSRLECHGTHIERLMQKHPEVIKFSEDVISCY